MGHDGGMITEHALLSVRPGMEDDFEIAFSKAKLIIASMPGFQGLTLSRCIENTATYLLLVEWDPPGRPYGRLQGLGGVPGMARAAASFLFAVSNGGTL